eukprot:2040753-Lingulodinium_polyedra.AAC.1
MSGVPVSRCCVAFVFSGDLEQGPRSSWWSAVISVEARVSILKEAELVIEGLRALLCSLRVGNAIVPRVP